jgi:two-component system cell cycle sensor histidine kinase/response regulator CckA
VRAALDARAEALAITDGDGRLVCANSAYGARCGGYPAPIDLAGDDLFARAAIEALAERARTDGAAEDSVALSIGEVRRDTSVSARLADASGVHLLWTLRRTSTEQVRDQTTALLDGALGRWLGEADVLLVMTDRDGCITVANDAFRAVAGDAVANLADALVVEGNSLAGLRRTDGTTRSMRMVELPLQPDGGPADSYLFLFLDEAPLAEAPAGPTAPDSVPALLGVLPLGLALADRDGRLTFMNAAFRAAAGATDDARVIYPSDLVVDEDKALVSDAVRRAASGPPKSRDLRIRLKHSPEEQVILTMARAPELGEAAVVLSLRDNREQLKLERQITQATKMQAVGQLAGGVAHDFNNILTAVIGYCDLMLMRHTPGDADFDDINQIRQNANRAANLVRQLLAFSRQQTLRPQLVQVSDVIGELSHLLKRLLGERVAFAVKHGRDLAPVRVDPGQLEQVIVNLCVNARDAMPGGGELQISTYAVAPSEVKKLGYEMVPPADYVAIAVKDSGTGIPKEIIGKIFEPFFTTKEVGKGTGLGLSTVYGIVKQTGGFIFADSEPGQGTTFTIYLPAHARARTPEAQAPAAPEPAKETWGKGTVLLVEDEGMVRAVAERALSRRGYEVLAAGNGEEALEILEGRPQGVDLLVSDVVMPTMDGPTLVRAARERFPDLRIIFMSGYAEEQLRKSIDLPGVAFLPKPFSVQDLSEAVRDALSRDALV